MARLIGPDESVRLVYFTSGANAGKATAQGLLVPLYADAALTTPANVVTLADGVIAGTPPTLTVDAYSQIPLFKFPDGVDIVYTSINGGPAVALYARTDDRLDALAVADAVVVSTAAADATTKANAAQAAAVQRGNHTGVQATGTVTGLDAALAAKADDAAGLPKVYRRTPQKKMLTTFQPGHGWYLNNGTWVTDTVDHVIGSQSVRTTVDGSAGAGLSASYRKFGQTPIDLTGRNFAILIKVDQPLNLYAITVYAGTGGLAGFNAFTASLGGQTGASTVEPGVWTWVHFTWADTSGPSGSPVNTAITDWQIAVVTPTPAAAGPVTVWWQAVATYPKPATYPNGVISLSFDDGHDDQYLTAAPIMDAYGWGGTAFVIVEVLGSVGSMTVAQVNELETTHGWEIAGHSFTSAGHTPGLQYLSAGALDVELRSLRNWLKQGQYKGADMLAWPGGGDSPAAITAAGKYFGLARQTVRAPMQTTFVDQPMRVRCYSVTLSDSLATLQTAVDRAYTGGAWLILNFHFIVASPTVQTEWSTANFTALMAYIAAKNMPVETMGQVLDTTS